MLKPLHDYVLLEKEKVEKTTSSGIILTSGKEKSKLAVVKAIGTGVEKPEYKVGDRVLYRENAGTNTGNYSSCFFSGFEISRSCRSVGGIYKYSKDIVETWNEIFAGTILWSR